MTSQLGSALLDLFLPQLCAGCAAAGQLWCPECQSACRGPLLETAVSGVGRALSAARHDGPVAGAVTAYKDGGRRGLVRPLSQLLARSVAGQLLAVGWRPGTVVAVVPVPSRRAALRARGADTMADLAGGAVRELRRAGVPARRVRVLSHRPGGRDQVGLTRAARLANMDGALALARRRPGQGRWDLLTQAGTVVVVDDVLTTGATLRAAVEQLRPALHPTGRRARVCAATITVAQARVGVEAARRGISGAASGCPRASRGGGH